MSIDSMDIKGIDEFIRVHTHNGLADGLVCKSVVNLI